MTIRYGARSADQIENKEVKATSVGAWSTSLTAIYETDPDLIAAVLPPPLEPGDEPLVRVSVASVDLGAGRPPFGAGTFAVQARHEGTVGNYPLVMPMTTEQSVVGGRETFGEPKKLAQVELVRDGDRITGKVTRLGTTFLELRGRVRREPGPAGRARTHRFLLQVPPGPRRQGLRHRARPRLLPPAGDGTPARCRHGRRDHPARIPLRPRRRSARSGASSR